MTKTTIEGRTLSYLDRGAGPVLVWIHAFPLSGRMWQNQTSIPDVRHIAPDLPGFGASDAYPEDVDPSIGRYAGDVVTLLDELEIHDAIFAGCSMGGYVVFEILRRAASRVRAVVLVDTRETEDSPAGRAGRAETIREVEKTGSITGLTSSMLPKLLSSSSARDQAIVSLTSGIMSDSSIEGVVYALGAMARRNDSAEVLRGFPGPALILAEAEDELIPRDDAERMAATAPAGELILIRGAGHLPPIERPEQFNDEISNFLHRETLST